jgi:hypothetical protein
MTFDRYRFFGNGSCEKIFGRPSESGPWPNIDMQARIRMYAEAHIPRDVESKVFNSIEPHYTTLWPTLRSIS